MLLVAPLAALPAHGEEAMIDVHLAVKADAHAIVATLRFSNRGDTPQSLDKHLACLDGQMRERVVDVRAGGVKVTYLLPMGKYPPPGFDDYVTLAPGQSLTATVHLEDAYAFAAGTHVYTVRYQAFHGRPDADALTHLVSNEVRVWVTR